MRVCLLFDSQHSLWNMDMTTAGKTNVLKLLLFLLSHFVVSSQVICRRPRFQDWHAQSRNITFKLSLMENTCRTGNQCWNGVLERWMIKSDAFPQLCPMEIQLGDALFAVTDPILEHYGVNLINVSKEDYDACLTEPAPKQHLFAGCMNGTMEVASNWLSPGVHYFTASQTGSSRLCQLGLRFSVLVKEQRCRSSPHLHMCSGKGICRAKTGQFTYTCRCPKPYSGQYCETLDMCSGGPCLNGATCINNQSLPVHYKCLCPPIFTGKSIPFSIPLQGCRGHLQCNTFGTGRIKGLA